MQWQVPGASAVLAPKACNLCLPPALYPPLQDCSCKAFRLLRLSTGEDARAYTLFRARTPGLYLTSRLHSYAFCIGK
jgi:hypothetical protein